MIRTLLLAVASAGLAPASHVVNAQALPDTVDLVTAIPVVRFERAVAMDNDKSETVYVADSATDQIVRLDLSTGSVERWAGPGGGLQQFDAPSDIDATNGLRIIVADEGNGRLVWLSADGVFVSAVSLGPTPGNFDSVVRRPVSIAAIGDAVVFIDAARSELLQWTPAQGVRRIAGGAGSPVFLVDPTAVTIDEDNIFVADEGSRSVLVFDRLGSLERQLCRQECAEIRNVGIVGTETVAVVLESEVRLYNRDGRLHHRIYVHSSGLVDASIQSSSILFLTRNGLYRIRY